MYCKDCVFWDSDDYYARSGKRSWGICMKPQVFCHRKNKKDGWYINTNLNHYGEVYPLRPRNNKACNNNFEICLIDR